MVSTTVGLVQINNSFPDACYFPYAVGLLQAYFQEYSDRARDYRFIEPIYRRLPVAKAVEHLQSAHIAAFSVYVWNYKLSLAIARELKKRNPNVMILFGGSHVPSQVEALLRNHPYVDIACHGEGERVFLEILEHYPEKTWSKVDSISYLDRGVFVQGKRGKRLKDIDAIPSPYLAGVFDSLVANHHEHKWLGLWETNRGCPFSCAYCDWGSAANTRLCKFEMDRLRAEIEWFAQKEVEFIFCCDANFGLLPRDLDIVKFVAQTKKVVGYPKALSVQSTKNATERTYVLQTMLSEAGLSKGVNLALQTVDEATLKNIGRSNISLTSFHDLQRRFNRGDVETFTDLILALPGETYESFTDGVNQIIENGQHDRIQFINLAILPNARMGDRDYQIEHGLLSVETKIINIHGSLVDADEDVFETQELVVATNTMPGKDWIRTRVFSWMTSLLYFDKLLQIPFVLLHEVCGSSYKRLVEFFVAAQGAEYPIISEMNSFFGENAARIQNGGPEYYHSPEWLNIYWPHDEYMVIRLVVQNDLEGFYEEAENIMCEMLRKEGTDVPPFLRDSLDLNEKLLKRPFQKEDIVVKTEFNVHEFYASVLRGDKTQLAKGTFEYEIDRTTETWASLDAWLKEVIWFGNKRGAYLYSIRRPEAASR